MDDNDPDDDHDDDHGDDHDDDHDHIFISKTHSTKLALEGSGHQPHDGRVDDPRL